MGVGVPGRRELATKDTKNTKFSFVSLVFFVVHLSG
jgi:hypothetical protein